MNIDNIQCPQYMSCIQHLNYYLLHNSLKIHSKVETFIYHVCFKEHIIGLKAHTIAIIISGQSYVGHKIHYFIEPLVGHVQHSL